MQSIGRAICCLSSSTFALIEKRETGNINTHREDPSIKESIIRNPLLFWLSISVGVSMLGFGIIWPLMPVYAAQLGAGGLEIGVIIASFNIARSIANPLIGRLSEFGYHKWLIAAGLLLCSVISPLYIIVPGIELLVVVRLLHGLAAALILPVALALTASIAPEKHLGKYLGTVNTAVMTGMGAGPILGGVLYNLYGMKTVFGVLGIMAFLAFLGVLLCLSKFPAAPPSTKRRSVERQGILLHRPILGLFVLRFFGSIGQGAVYTFLPVLAVKMNLMSSQVGLVLSANIFMIAFLQRYCGTLADEGDPLRLMVVSAVCSGVVVALMPLKGFFPVIFTLNILMGLLNAVALASGYVIAGSIGRRYGMGGIMGILDTGQSLGFVVAPIGAGIIFDLYGIGPVFYLGGTIVVMAGMAAHLLLKTWEEYA